LQLSVKKEAAQVILCGFGYYSDILNEISTNHSSFPVQE